MTTIEEEDISFWLDEQLYTEQENFYEDMSASDVDNFENFIYHLKMHSLFCFMIIYKNMQGTSLEQQVNCHWDYYYNKYVLKNDD